MPRTGMPAGQPLWHAPAIMMRGEVCPGYGSHSARPHSGFHVNHSVRFEADDACGILQLTRYAVRAPVSLERLQYDTRKQQVLGPTRAGALVDRQAFPPTPSPGGQILGHR